MLVVSYLFYLTTGLVTGGIVWLLLRYRVAWHPGKQESSASFPSLHG
jgi:hypothetical protein